MPLTLKGSSSGGVTLDVPAVAGANTVTIPAATGTLTLASTSVANEIFFGGATSGVLYQSSNLQFDGLNLGVGGAPTNFGAGYANMSLITSSGAAFYDAKTTTVTMRMQAVGTTNGAIGTYTNHPFYFYTNSALVGTLDTSGNLGLGVTPSAWNSGVRALQLLNGWGSIAANNGNGHFELIGNAYIDASGNWAYATQAGSFGAARYTINNSANGSHYWYTASGGAAGTPVTWSQVMSLSNNGSLALSAAGSTAGQGTTVYVAGPNGLNSGYTSFGMQTNGSDTTKPRGALFVFGSTWSSSYQSLVANSCVLSSAYCDLNFNTETAHNINFYPYGSYAGRFDTSGNFLVGTATTGGGKICVKNTPTSQWGIDFNECVVSIANGSNAALPSGSGMVLLTDPTQSGATAVYIMGAATVALASTVNGTFVPPTTSPGAGTASIQYGSGAYRIYNNIGTTISFRVAMFRTRDSV